MFFWGAWAHKIARLSLLHVRVKVYPTVQNKVTQERMDRKISIEQCEREEAVCSCKATLNKAFAHTETAMNNMYYTFGQHLTNKESRLLAHFETRIFVSHWVLS
jgi:hypothetical protein